MDLSYNLNGGFQPTTKRSADLNGADFYPTPTWATHALLQHETFCGEIWEPACGDGQMSNVLKTTGCAIRNTDLYDRGFGDSGVDFLEQDIPSENIVTNPPYNSAEGFVRAANRLASKKFALLLRLAFLEGGKRAQGIFKEMPPSRIWVFSERITFYPKGAVKKGSGTTAYAWFVWDKGQTGNTQLGWIPPGTKAKFSESNTSGDLFL